MDDLDRKLVALLSRDARASVTALAKALGVSRGTILNRMARMEKARVIRGYGVKLRPGADDAAVRAWTCVRVEGVQTRKVVAALLGEPGVETLYDTNGRWDLLAGLQAATMSELSELLARIRLINGIGDTETSIQLAAFR